MKKCTCSKEDGIHEWNCAIEVEKRNNLEAQKTLEYMAPFFGLKKEKTAHGYRWAEKSLLPESRPTQRPADGGDSSASNEIPEEFLCSACDGTGYVDCSPCQSCDGHGFFVDDYEASRRR